MVGAVKYLGIALQLLPQLIQAGVDSFAFISRMKSVADRGAVLDEDWDALHEHENLLRGKLHSDVN